MTIVTSCTSPTIGTQYTRRNRVRCRLIAANRRMCWRSSMPFSGPCVRPLDGNLLSNNAYMLITSLAWNLKAALVRTVSSGTLRTQKGQAGRTEALELLMMEFRTFVNFLVRVTFAQVVRTGRRLVVRLMTPKTSGSLCSCDWSRGCNGRSAAADAGLPGNRAADTRAEAFQKLGNSEVPVRRGSRTQKGNQ